MTKFYKDGQPQASPQASDSNACKARQRLRLARLLSSVSLILLILLCVAWELWLAPLRPNGTWLVLKAVPLLLPLFGILHGRRYTYQWATLLIQVYLLEGLARSSADSGMMQALAAAEVVTALVFLVAAISYARLTAPSRLKAAD